MMDEKRDLITGGSFIADDLRSDYINKTDRWLRYWLSEDLSIPCPLDDGLLDLCHFKNNDIPFTPHLHVLESGEWRCGWQCDYGRWYLIQTAVNSGVIKARQRSLKLTGKCAEGLKAMVDMELGEFDLLFIDIHKIEVEIAELFVNKLRWRVIINASRVDAEVYQKRVIYIDSLTALEYIHLFRNDKITTNELNYWNSVEWLFINLSSQLMSDKNAEYFYNLIKIRSEHGKKTVLINYENDLDYTLLYGRKRVHSIIYDENDLVYKEEA